MKTHAQNLIHRLNRVIIEGRMCVVGWLVEEIVLNVSTVQREILSET